MEQTKKIAFQGHKGAYSDLACRITYPEMAPLPCPSFEDAFRAVREQQAEYAMIPVDNVLAGRVADVHHLLPEGGLYIIAEHFQPIRHALLGVKGAKLEDLEHVHSHVHAIPQCRKMIRQLSLTPHVHGDTAGAAAFVADQGCKQHAAIASSLTAEIYGLDILAENLQDEDYNTTRFLVFSREMRVPAYDPDEAVLTSLMFRVRNIPAALYKTLGGFATNGINMAKLESYVDEKFQAALFYCEVEGHPDSPGLKNAIEELGFFAHECKHMGTYPLHPFRTKS